MANQKLISFDLQADFGFFKKPDYNIGILLSYNLLHKPALLGILGAIIGLKGYEKKGEFPEYYQLLKDIQLGIEPLEGYHEKGNFSKTSVKYTNTVGYANADGNLLVEETMLIKPAYRCYLLLSLEDENQSKLYQYLKTGQAEYIPYFGKNEFQAWWHEGIQEYSFTPFEAKSDFKISSLFIRESTIRENKVAQKFSFAIKGMINQSSFSYFERLPVDFHEKLYQYELAEFAYTDWTLRKDSQISDLYEITDSNTQKVIQLF